MFTRKQHAKKEMKEPNQRMSEKLLEFVSDGVQKTEQALFKLKFDLEKDLNSKLPPFQDQSRFTTPDRFVNLDSKKVSYRKSYLATFEVEK